MVAGVIVHFRHAARQKRCVACARGEVIDVIEETTTESDSDGGTIRRRYFHPVFAYRVDGRILTEKSNVGTGRPRFAIGEIVTVRYNPDKPEEYIVEEDAAKAGSGLWILGFGALWSLVSLLFVLIALFG